MHFVPESPGKLKIAKGHYETRGADGLVYTVIRNDGYGDWDARGPDGALHAREALLGDALQYLDEGFCDRTGQWKEGVGC